MRATATTTTFTFVFIRASFFASLYLQLLSYLGFSTAKFSVGVAQWARFYEKVKKNKKKPNKILLFSVKKISLLKKNS